LAQRVPQAISPSFDLPAGRLSVLDGSTIPANALAALFPALQDEVGARRDRQGLRERGAGGKFGGLCFRWRRFLRDGRRGWWLRWSRSRPARSQAIRASSHRMRWVTVPAQSIRRYP